VKLSESTHYSSLANNGLDGLNLTIAAIKLADKIDDEVCEADFAWTLGP